MNVADDFREAAKVLRERAEAAPKGPWTVAYLGDHGNPQRVTNAEATLIANTYEGGGGLRPTPEYIRMMHPLVGLALADLFDRFAAMAESGAVAAASVGVDPTDIQWPVEPQALKVARLILGGAR